MFDTLFPSALMTAGSVGLGCLWWLATSACHVWTGILYKCYDMEKVEKCLGAPFLLGLLFSTALLCPLPFVQNQSDSIHYFSRPGPLRTLERQYPFNRWRYITTALIIKRERPCSRSAQSWVWFEKAPHMTLKYLPQGESHVPIPWESLLPRAKSTFTPMLPLI